MKQALEPTADAAWILNDDGCDSLRESDRETRFTVSNGFLAARASLAINQPPERIAPPSTYVAGLFDTRDAVRAVPELVPAPDWLQVRVALAGEQLVQHFDPGPSHPLTLDMRRGLLFTECRLVEGSAVSVRLRLLRLVSQDRRSLGLQLVHLEVERGETEITLEASFEGVDSDLRAERLENEFGVWRTRHSAKRLAMAAAVALQIDGEDLAPTALAPFRWSWTWRSCPGQIVCLERIVAVARSDAPDQDPGKDARYDLEAGRQSGWRSLLAQHETAWTNRWSCSDVEVEGDAAAQKALRFAVYHLNSAANPDDPRVSIGARALTGADYRGHVFWDTEIFLLPFYILTWPEAARSLLMYRFHTLGGARAKAADHGWRGAFYAWESTDTGQETTPDQVIGPDRQIIDILTGSQEQHISADVAYAVWQYWQATGDEAFLIDAGAEILLETGRFWSSRAQPEADGFHHIRDVIGPDEYHEGIDDNAFTNVMARWNIRRALDVAALLRERWPAQWTALSRQLDLDDAELEHWAAVAQTIATGLNPDTGLFEQFTGYFDLEDVDLSAYAGRSVPMDVVLGRQRTQRSQVIKQADVVALIALLSDEFAGETGATNFGYYEPRCGHGSSLSSSMHGLVAARLGKTELALDYFHRTAAIDLADTKVAIGGGIHIAAQGGLWMMSVLGFAGLSLRDDGVALAPRLPVSWSSLGFSIQWRGRRLTVRIHQADHRLEAVLRTGEPMVLTLYGRAHALSLDQALAVDLRRSDPE